MAQPLNMSIRDILNEVDGPVMLHGFLRKQGHFIRNWKRRRFILTPHHLFYAPDSDVAPSTLPRGVIAVSDIAAVVTPLPPNRHSTGRGAVAASAAAPATSPLPPPPPPPPPHSRPDVGRSHTAGAAGAQAPHTPTRRASAVDPAVASAAATAFGPQGRTGHRAIPGHSRRAVKSWSMSRRASAPSVNFGTPQRRPLTHTAATASSRPLLWRFEVKTKSGKDYLIEASTQHERALWVAAIQRAQGMPSRLSRMLVRCIAYRRAGHISREECTKLTDLLVCGSNDALDSCVARLAGIATMAGDDEAEGLAADAVLMRTLLRWARAEDRRFVRHLQRMQRRDSGVQAPTAAAGGGGAAAAATAAATASSAGPLWLFTNTPYRRRAPSLGRQRQRSTSSSAARRTSVGAGSDTSLALLAGRKGRSESASTYATTTTEVDDDDDGFDDDDDTSMLDDDETSDYLLSDEEDEESEVDGMYTTDATALSLTLTPTSAATTPTTPFASPKGLLTPSVADSNTPRADSGDETDDEGGPGEEDEEGEEDGDEDGAAGAGASASVGAGAGGGAGAGAGARNGSSGGGVGKKARRKRSETAIGCYAPIVDRDFHEAYKIGTKLGEGAFSIVFKCTRRRDGKEFAVKVINASSLDPVMTARLHNEVAVLSLLRHPNIMRLEEVFESPDGHYVHIVAELMSGGELLDRMKDDSPATTTTADGATRSKCGYTEAEAVEVIRAVVGAIRYCHARGVVHRDLKPENILFSTPDPDTAVVKLADMGLSARVQGGSAHKASLVDYVGSPSYMAPEVLLGARHGPPVDLWSIGVVAYTLLSGCMPFGGGTEEALNQSIVSGQYSFPSTYWGHISEPAKDFVRRLLVINCNKRMTARQASHHPWLKEPSPATALAAPSTGSTATSASTATAATGLASPSTPATATTGRHGGGVDGEAAVGSSPGVGGASNGAALLATAAEARAQADAAARRRVERVIAHMGRVLVACRALGVVHSGQLTKQGAIMRNWQRRVFTLTCDRLTYAKEDEARGFIAMEEVTAVQASDRHSIKLVTRGRTWNLEANSPRDRLTWLASLIPVQQLAELLSKADAALRNFNVERAEGLVQLATEWGRLLHAIIKRRERRRRQASAARPPPPPRVAASAATGPRSSHGDPLLAAAARHTPSAGGRPHSVGAGVSGRSSSGSGSGNGGGGGGGGGSDGERLMRGRRRGRHRGRTGSKRGSKQTKKTKKKKKKQSASDGPRSFAELRGAAVQRSVTEAAMADAALAGPAYYQQQQLQQQQQQSKRQHTLTQSQSSGSTGTSNTTLDANALASLGLSGGTTGSTGAPSPTRHITALGSPSHSPRSSPASSPRTGGRPGANSFISFKPGDYVGATPGSSRPAWRKAGLGPSVGAGGGAAAAASVAGASAAASAGTGGGGGGGVSQDASSENGDVVRAERPASRRWFQMAALESTSDDDGHTSESAAADGNGYGYGSKRATRSAPIRPPADAATGRTKKDAAALAKELAGLAPTLPPPASPLVEGGSSGSSVGASSTASSASRSTSDPSRTRRGSSSSSSSSRSSASSRSSRSSRSIVDGSAVGIAAAAARRRSSGEREEEEEEAASGGGEEVGHGMGELVHGLAESLDALHSLEQTAGVA